MEGYPILDLRLKAKAENKWLGSSCCKWTPPQRESNSYPSYRNNWSEQKSSREETIVLSPNSMKGNLDRGKASDL